MEIFDPHAFMYHNSLPQSQKFIICTDSESLGGRPPLSPYGRYATGCNKWHALGVSSWSLLFILYINNLPDRLRNACKLYADDSKILAIIKDLSCAVSLQSDLNALTEWIKLADALEC